MSLLDVKLKVLTKVYTYFLSLHEPVYFSLVGLHGPPTQERPPALEGFVSSADDEAAQMGSSLAPCSLFCMDPGL